MSLQDDYFELNAKLKGWQREALNRIWDAFVEIENEHEQLCQLRNCVRGMIELTFEEKSE